MPEPEKMWVTRWVVAMCEPLLETSRRAEIESKVTSLIAARPHWFAAWLSGYLSDVVCSLDPADPWRNLTVREGKVLHPDQTPFGTWVDATDIVAASVEDPASDLGLSALVSPLEGEALELFAVAPRGWHETLAWCERRLVTTAELDEEAAKHFFSTAASALRWAIHRRRVFAGSDDPFVPVSGVAWIGRADKMTSGTHWDEARAALHLKQSSIDAGTYNRFV